MRSPRVGADAVDEAARAIGAGPSSWVLDLGAGIGGPARHLAATTGARVTALELQADLDRLGSDLTDRCGLVDRVDHVAADILDPMLPQRLGERSHDALVSMLCILHIPDRAGVFGHLTDAGFTDVEVLDMTEDWSEFVHERLAAFRASSDELTARYNAATVALLDRFYGAVAALFAGGNLGGLRLTATAPG